MKGKYFARSVLLLTFWCLASEQKISKHGGRGLGREVCGGEVAGCWGCRGDNKHGMPLMELVFHTPIGEISFPNF